MYVYSKHAANRVWAESSPRRNSGMIPHALLQPYDVSSAAEQLYKKNVLSVGLSEEGIVCLNAIHPGSHPEYDSEQPQSKALEGLIAGIAQDTLRYALSDASIHVKTIAGGATDRPMPQPFWHTDPGNIGGAENVHMFAVVASSGGSTIAATPFGDTLFELSDHKTTIPNGVQAFKFHPDAKYMIHNNTSEPWFCEIPEHRIIIGFTDIVDSKEACFLSDKQAGLQARAVKHISPVKDILQSGRDGFGKAQEDIRRAFVCRLRVERSAAGRSM